VAELDVIANALYQAVDAAMGGDLGTSANGQKLLQMGTLPSEAEEEFPAITYRLSSFVDSFGVIDSYWIFNAYDDNALDSAVLAKKLSDLFRNARQWQNGIGYKSEARILNQVIEVGAVNTPVEVRVTTI
jgi:hypothetical protein